MIIRGKVRKIEIDFTWINKRDFTKIIRENNNNNKLIIKKTLCHSLIKKTLHNAINNTGMEKKKRWGLWSAFSKE